MSRDPVFLRVDATPRTGYERLARCLILAAALLSIVLNPFVFALADRLAPAKKAVPAPA